MALRTIVKEGDDRLRKVCRPVEKFDGRLHELLDDMAETMHDAEGVGLAAPQVGILRRVVVIDIGEGVIEMVNPKIVYESRQCETKAEGCLSSPGEYGMVPRPHKVVCEYLDRNGEKQEITGTELLARAICHECDHLDGRLFKDLAVRMIDPDEELEGE
jgi:peptide deformylase